MGKRQTAAVVSIGPERGELSGRAAMIEAEQPAQALTADGLARVREERGIGVDELVADALMWPLRIEMDCVGIKGSSK